MVAVGVGDGGVALAPERVPRNLVDVEAGLHDLCDGRVHLGRVRALEGEAHRRAADGGRPVRVETVDDRDGVEHDPDPSGAFAFDVSLGIVGRRELQSEQAVEGQRAGHVGDGDADGVEGWSHG